MQATHSTDREALGPETLRCQGIEVAFDGVHALDGIDLALEKGSILGLIGTNGAGKTTLVNVLSGYQRPTAGQAWVGELEVTGWSPSRLAHAGVVRTFQSGRLFPALTVYEHVEAAALGVGRSHREAREIGWPLLERAGLAERANVEAAALPQGDVHKLGIARALAAQPRFVLVDEPAAGSNEEESDELLEMLRWIATELEIGMLIIEHDMSLILRLCERIQVLDHGKTIAVGPPAEVRAEPRVIEAYLGTTVVD